MPALPSITFPPEQSKDPWAAALATRTQSAVLLAAERLGLPPPREVRVVTFARQMDFQAYLGAKPVHIVAVARAEESEIIILRPELFSQSPGEQAQTLVHEAAHLILGRNVRGHMPAWLNEGLAQITARQQGFGMDARLTFAGSFGTLIPLATLEDTLAIGGGDTQPLAYAQALAITKFLIHRKFPAAAANDPKPLAQLLADPVEGPKFLDDMRDPTLRQALELQWMKSQRTVWNWVAALSGGGFLMSFGAAMLVLAYWRKRRMTRLVQERFGAEEARDRELGVEIPPWEYEGDGEPEQEEDCER